MTLVDLSGVKQAKEYVTLSNKMLELEVVKARQGGTTWQALGDALGVTHQGARSRWAPIVAKALASTNGDGAESANGVQHGPDHAGRVDGDAIAGPGDDGD